MNEYSVVERTAYNVADHRGRTDIPYAKEIAEISEAEKIRNIYASDEDEAEKLKRQKRMDVAFEARYKSINKLIISKDIKNIVEIACGISPRGLELTKNPDIQYLGTDLENMISRSQKIMSQVLESKGESRDNLDYQVADALDSEASKRVVYGKFSEKPVTIVSEGLFIYEDDDERQRVINNILEILKQNGGCWITTDLMNMPVFRSDTGKRSNFAENTDANMTPLFNNPEEVIEYYNELGFDVECIPQSIIFDDLSSLQNIDDDKREIYRKGLSQSYAFMIEPKK